MHFINVTSCRFYFLNQLWSLLVSFLSRMQLLLRQTFPLLGKKHFFWILFLCLWHSCICDPFIISRKYASNVKVTYDRMFPSEECVFNLFLYCILSKASISLDCSMVFDVRTVWWNSWLHLLVDDSTHSKYVSYKLDLPLSVHFDPLSFNATHSQLSRCLMRGSFCFCTVR